MTVNWETLTTVLSALGGLELLKFLITFRSRRRSADAEADTAEISAIAASRRLQDETIQFLQTQLREKESRFAEQTELLRATTREELRLTRVNKELEMQLMMKRCDIIGCGLRRPPLPWLDSDGSAGEGGEGREESVP